MQRHLCTTLIYIAFSFQCIGKVWIVGDSIVFWAAHYLVEQGEHALNLRLPVTVTWKGLRGAHLSAIPSIIYQALVRHHAGSECAWPCSHAPRHVVLHVGTNDVLSLDLIQFKLECERVLAECRRLLPFAVIVWSDILPRHWYEGACSQSAVDKKRKSMNKTARSIVWGYGGVVIKHANFNWACRSLFREDFVHLDIFGQFLLTNNLRKGLQHFLRDQTAYVYRAGNLGNR